MEKDVLITVKGMQKAGEESDNQSITCQGVYHMKNMKHYISYEEDLEDGKKKTVIKLIDDENAPCVDVITTGAVETHMVFEKNRKKLSPYNTPYGTFLLEFLTKDIAVFVSEESIIASIKYSISMEGKLLSENAMDIKVESKA